VEKTNNMNKLDDSFGIF